MRKQLSIAVVILLLIVGVAFAQTWHTANQATVAWDAVTTLGDGSPLPAGDTMEYVVYLSNAITDPNKDNPTEVTTVTATSHLITLNVEGSFFVCVKAVRKLADTTVVGESEVAWSDDPQYVQAGETFGLRYFLPPAAIKNMRPV